MKILIYEDLPQVLPAGGLCLKSSSETQSIGVYKVPRLKKTIFLCGQYGQDNVKVHIFLWYSIGIILRKRRLLTFNQKIRNLKKIAIGLLGPAPAHNHVIFPKT